MSSHEGLNKKEGGKGMPLLRVFCKGRCLNLARDTLTMLKECCERSFLYRPPVIKRKKHRGRSGKVKIFTRDEIMKYEKREARGNG